MQVERTVLYIFTNPGKSVRVAATMASWQPRRASLPFRFRLVKLGRDRFSPFGRRQLEEFNHIVVLSGPSGILPQTHRQTHPPWHSHPSSPTSKTTPAQPSRARNRQHHHNSSKTRHSARPLPSPPAPHQHHKPRRHRSRAHQISLRHQRTIRQNSILWLRWVIIWIIWRWRMRKLRICRERGVRCLVEGGRMSCVTERGRRI